MKSKSRYIGLALFLLIGLLPFGLALMYALLYSFGIVGIANDGFTTKFWQQVFAEGTFVQSMLYSTVISILSVVFSVGIAMLIAINYVSKLEKPFMSFMSYLPLCMPGIVVAFFLIQILSEAGWISRIAYSIGLIDQLQSFPSLVNDSLAFGIIVAFISVVMPFFLLLFISVYRQERLDELAHVASSLGASPQQIAIKIKIPILLHRTRMIIILYFIFLLGAYEIPLILGQESPQMISVMVVRELNQYDLTKISEGYVVAVMYTMLISLLTLVVFLYGRSKTVSYA